MFIKYNNEPMVTVYYNDSKISEDILTVTKNSVLNFEIYESVKGVQNTWRDHNEKALI